MIFHLFGIGELSMEFLWIIFQIFLGVLEDIWDCEYFYLCGQAMG